MMECNYVKVRRGEQTTLTRTKQCDVGIVLVDGAVIHCCGVGAGLRVCMTIN